jgi:superfamily II DNA or RNA helicase
MTHPELRDYQIRSIELVRDSYRSGHKAPLLCLPTAAGKTIIFSQATRLAQLKGTTALIAVHRHELIRQTVAKLQDAGVEPGIIAASKEPNPNAAVQVASVQTAIRRDIGQFGLLICDEAHHAVATTWRKIIAAQPGVFLLGCTATPARLDGKGLGTDHDGIFDDLIVGATVAELTESGWLCPARTYAPKTMLDLRDVQLVAGDYNQGELTRAVMGADIAGDAVAEYRRRADHQAAVAFCVSIEHAEQTALAFQRAGYRAAAVHGKLKRDERDHLVTGLASGEIEILASCEILGEGVDIPTIGAAILLRPTRSLTVYMQQVGRGLRPAPGKDHLVVLDLAGNSLEHGLVDEPRAWTLAGTPKRQSGAQTGWLCSACDRLNPAGAAFCLDCGAARPARPREFTINPHDELVELERQASEQRIARLSYRAFMSQPRTRRELEIYRRAHGYKKGWLWHAKRQQTDMFEADR